MNASIVKLSYNFSSGEYTYTRKSRGLFWQFKDISQASARRVLKTYGKGTRSDYGHSSSLTWNTMYTKHG